MKKKKIQQVTIGLASPKQIREWAERELPTGEIVGEVTSWETVNYKTLKPEPNGLFCQKIFGPVLDYICLCPKQQNKVYEGFCLKCGVERTTSRVRRYRLGYIKLKQPVVHTLYASQRPSPLTICLNWSNKRVQAITYAAEFCKLPSSFANFFNYYPIKRFLWKDSNLSEKKCSNQSNKSLFLYTCSHPKKQKFIANKKRFKNFVNETYVSKGLRFNKLVLKKTYSFKKGIQLFREKFIYFEPTKLKSVEKKPKLFNNSSINKEMRILMRQGYWSSATYQYYVEKLKLKNKLNTYTFVYGTSYDATWSKVEKIQKFLFYVSDQSKSNDVPISYYKWLKALIQNTSGGIPKHKQFYPIQTGGFVFQTIFSYFQLLGFYEQIRVEIDMIKKYLIFLKEKIDWYERNGGEIKEWRRIVRKVRRLKEYKKKCIKRLIYFRDFYKKRMNLAWMILSYIPVLPPGLRPIMSIEGQLIISDINSLYRKVIIRNKRVQSMTQFGIFDTALSGSWASWCYNFRQVQESIDSLFKTGTSESGKTTKSLLDSLKGKKGRFRQHLLGKRVDYSGRSVIVVGPTLKIYECGLPKQMALELFQPFLIQKLRNKRIALTTTSAKIIITEKKPIVWSILAEIMKNHPVLLNRAPTLHRLGIQAFLPRLVEGKALLLHPLVCPAFNADFDGDQMAVHIPLGAASRSEAFQLMWSRNHLLAPSSGQPLLLPTQDMVLGCYYLTIFKNSKLQDYKTKLLETKNVSYSGFYFSTFYEVIQSYQQKTVNSHTPVWVRWFGIHQNLISQQESKITEQPLEFRIDIGGKSDYIFHDRHYEKPRLFHSEIFNYSNCFSKNTLIQNYIYIRTTPGRILFHTKFPR